MSPRKQSRGGQIYVARDSGAAEVDGTEYTFHQGRTRVRAGHPLTKMDGFDELFEPADEHIHYDTEQATAAPDETRNVTLAGDATGSLEDMTVPELREYAKAHGVTPGTMNKQELLDAVTAPEEGED